MLKKLDETAAFLAGDLTTIRELIHVKNDFLNLPYSMALATLSEGKSSLPHRLVSSSEVYFILGGIGKMYLEDETFHVETGDTVFIPANALQWISNTGTELLRFLCIVSPPWNEEDELIEKNL